MKVTAGFSWEGPKQTPYVGLRVSPWQFPVAAGSTTLLPALPVSSCFSLVRVSPFSLWEIVLSSLQLSTCGYEFLDARGCLASSSEKALTGQRPSGPWLWLIRVLVTMPQFPLLALWSHRCYSSCVIFNPLPQPLPESSSSTVFKSLNIRFKKVKPTLFLSALPGPFSVLVPGCSAQPAQHLAICDVTHQPTALSWVGCSVGPWAGLTLPSEQLPLLHCLAQSCDGENVLSEGNPTSKTLRLLPDQLVCSAVPKEGHSISLVCCCPFPVWIPLQHLQIPLASWYPLNQVQLHPVTWTTAYTKSSQSIPFQHHFPTPSFNGICFPVAQSPSSFPSECGDYPQPSPSWGDLEAIQTQYSMEQPVLSPLEDQQPSIELRRECKSGHKTFWDLQMKRLSTSLTSISLAETHVKHSSRNM